ncbi:hypothetical protein [Anaerobutyricum soehngenii]
MFKMLAASGIWHCFFFLCFGSTWNECNSLSTSNFSMLFFGNLLILC